MADQIRKITSFYAIIMTDPQGNEGTPRIADENGHYHTCIDSSPDLTRQFAQQLRAARHKFRVVRFDRAQDVTEEMT